MNKFILRKGDIIELHIESLAFGGEGVARVQSGEKPLVVFVEDVVPGDKVEVKIGTKKKNFARGLLQKIVEPSPDRVQPRCVHFGSSFENRGGEILKGCGGCVWQFLDVQKQREIKEQQVREALKRIGGLEENVVLPILGGEPWFYRNKMEFSFGRNLKGASDNSASGEEMEVGARAQHTSAQEKGDITLGLHVKRRHYDVIELRECFLLEPFAGELVKFVGAFFQNFEKEHGFDEELVLKSFTVRVGKNTGEVMMILAAENGEENFMSQFSKALQTFCLSTKIPLTSLYFLHLSNHKGEPNRVREELVFGKPTIQEALRLADGTALHFEISPQAFFQPNTAMAQVLYAKTLEAAGLTGKETVFDLYCGTGTIGLFCASKAAKVYGVELNASAVANARANAKLNGITNAEFLVGDVQQILPTLKDAMESEIPGLKKATADRAPDVVLVDPPRNGLAPKVVESIVEFGPKRIVYVSCNPTSLARDAALFQQSRYRLLSVQPVDQFPQTYHIECVAVFESR